MKHDTLVTQLSALGVTVNDTYRAGIYIKNIQDTDTYLKSLLKAEPTDANDPALGARVYTFCAPALNKVNLLDELAGVLDYYVGPGVVRDLTDIAKPANDSYVSYFEREIFDESPAKYQDHIDKFKERYPTTADALAHATANFQSNISIACKRIYDDAPLIETLFEEEYGDAFRLLNLTNIKATGSDFHKGGKQVLILTFACSNVTQEDGKSVVNSVDLKLVYKPSDLEADCLLAGDSVAVNRTLHKTFMTNSLFEIYNDQLSAHKSANPGFSGLPLNTYKILPRNYLSDHDGALPATLREAYGYLQYLDYDVKGTASHYFGFYPYASSDFIIFWSEPKTQIVSDFYKMLGAMTAISSSFSMVDLHIENVRVVRRQPYFIDMEICLAESIADVRETILLGNNGGITGVNLNTQDFTWVASNINTAGAAALEKVYKDQFYQNRLWQTSGKKPEDNPADAAFNDGSREMIPVNTTKLLEGFDDGMAVLKTAVAADAFGSWFTRLNNVVVRYLPFGTADFKKVANQVYMDGPIDTAPKTPTQTIITKSLLQNLTLEYDGYIGKGDTALDPAFVVFNQTDAGDDYANLDIPVFYHQIGTTGIVNSHGDPVAIPAEITVIDLDSPPNTKTVKVAPPTPPGCVDRSTYFASAPTTNVVKTDQVDVLNTDTADERISTLRGSISSYFGTNGTDVSTAFTPIGKKG